MTQARTELADLVNRAAYGGEHVVLTRHGRPVAAIVSAADLARLDALDAAVAAGGSDVSDATVLDLVAGHVAARPAAPDLGIAARHQPDDLGGPGLGAGSHA